MQKTLKNKIKNFVTLTIQDSKPFVEFFSKLGNIISNFEDRPTYQHFEQKSLAEVKPLT